MCRTVKLGDNCLVTDYVANGSFQSLRENVKYQEGEGFAILVRLTDFTKGWNGNYKYVTEDAYKFLSKSSLYVGDLVISNVGEPGKTFLVPELGQPMTLAPNSILVRPNSETILTEYLKYFIDSKYGQALIRSIESGTTQRKFNKTSFRGLEIPLPPLAEQQRIVAKLDAAFAEIDRAIESYEDSVLNAKDCLSKLRASRIKEVLSSSQTAKLGDLASLKNGLNYSKSEKGYSAKILGVGDFGNRFSIGTEDLQVIETSSPVSTDYHLEHGDIVFVRSNGNKQLIGRSIVIENPSEPATFSGFCIRCRIETDDISPLFLCHYLKSSVVREKLISEGGGANISNLNQKMLADIDVPLLSQHEQISLIRWIEKLEKGFEDFVATLIKRVQLANNLKSAILTQELQTPQSEAA